MSSERKTYIISISDGPDYIERNLTTEEYELIRGIIEEVNWGSIEEPNPMYEVDLNGKNSKNGSTLAHITHWGHLPQWISNQYYGTRYFKTRKEVEEFLKDKTYSSIFWKDAKYYC